MDQLRRVTMNRATVDALALRMRLEDQLDTEANDEAQRIVDDLIREQARADASDEDELDLTLVLDPLREPRRRLHIYRSEEPGVAYAAEHDEDGGCSWRPTGRERLRSVELDGERFGAMHKVEDGP